MTTFQAPNRPSLADRAEWGRLLLAFARISDRPDERKRAAKDRVQRLVGDALMRLQAALSDSANILQGAGWQASEAENLIFSIWSGSDDDSDNSDDSGPPSLSSPPPAPTRWPSDLMGDDTTPPLPAFGGVKVPATGGPHGTDGGLTQTLTSLMDNVAAIANDAPTIRTVRTTGAAMTNQLKGNWRKLSYARRQAILAEAKRKADCETTPDRSLSAFMTTIVSGTRSTPPNYLRNFQFRRPVAEWMRQSDAEGSDGPAEVADKQQHCWFERLCDQLQPATVWALQCAMAIVSGVGLLQWGHQLVPQLVTTLQCHLRDTLCPDDELRLRSTVVHQLHLRLLATGGRRPAQVVTD